MNTVLSLILMLAQNNLEKGISYNISNYIIDHLFEINEMSMQQLASKCFISTSSITKYCRMLGFNSYTEFKWHLNSTIQSRKLQLHEKQEKLTFEKLFEKIQSLSYDQIDKDALLQKVAQTTKIINQTKKICIYGAVFPLFLTQSFSEDMAIMKVPVHNEHIGYGPISVEQKDSTILIITISGRFQETHQSEYRKIKQLNPNTILLSQDISHLSDITINFPMPKTDSSEYDDLVVLLLLDMIKHHYYINYYD